MIDNANEISEIKGRAELICNKAIQSLESNLTTLHRQNAAKRMLRSGPTVKASTKIIRTTINNYFQELEQFIKSRPKSQLGFEIVIIESISFSTTRLINAINDGLLKTAELAGNIDYIHAVENEITEEISTSQQLFLSNLRTHLTNQSSERQLTLSEILILSFEIILSIALIVISVMWVQSPNRLYEPYLALLAAGITLIDIYRRHRSRKSG